MLSTLLEDVRPRGALFDRSFASPQILLAAQHTRHSSRDARAGQTGGNLATVMKKPSSRRTAFAN